MLNSRIFSAFAILAGALLSSSPAWAAGEVSGFGGGITINSGGGTHPLFGGAGGVQVGEHGLLFGEFSYSPLASATLSSADLGVSNASGSGSLHLATYGGGYDYSFGSSKTLVPYAVVALGAAVQTLSASASVAGVSASTSMSSTAFDFGFGGGVRFFATKRWGFKPEVRYQRMQASSGGNSTLSYSVGFFYSFGK
jgi:hypothetical protein